MTHGSECGSVQSFNIINRLSRMRRAKRIALKQLISWKMGNAYLTLLLSLTELTEFSESIGIKDLTTKNTKGTKLTRSGSLKGHMGILEDQK